MKVTVWQTGHSIADTVAGAMHEGLHKSGINHSLKPTSLLSEQEINASDVHIGYGILRGMGDVFRVCDKAGKPWFNVDKGYWKPNHYDGYYRISLRCTQQTTGLDKLEPDYERWDKLGIEIISSNISLDHTMLCPPTIHVANFFAINDDEQWKYNAVQDLIDEDIKFFTRYKGDEHPINWQSLGGVRTFNSSVGWEALRQGIPVVSDQTHSLVGSYQKMVDKPLHLDYEARRELFALMSSLQLTLDEIRNGCLWPLVTKLLSISGGIAVKL